MNRRRFIKHALASPAILSPPWLLSGQWSGSHLPSDLTDLGALDLSMAIKTRQVSCAEVMQAYLERIHRFNPVYNAIISMADDDVLMQQAREADAALSRNEYRGWMHGMPHAIKDLAPLKGFRYTSGSPLFTDRIADEDSELAARIRQRGAIFIGKTNTPEFGLGSQTYNTVFGATGSAYNPDLTAGGSSGGAACGLATHMLPVADGGDMMGSLRNPGAFNNVIGFRPSTNVMMEEEKAGEERPLSTSGPMGRSTRDTIRFLQTIALHPDFDSIEPLKLEGIHIGWLGNLDGYLAFEPGILELCENSLKRIAEAGGGIDSIQLNFDPANLWQCWTTLRHHGRREMLEFYEDPDTRDLLKPELIWEIEEGLRISDEDVRSANEIRAQWYMTLDDWFDIYDFLVLPTAQVFPFPKDLHWPKSISGRTMDTYHRWMEVVIPGSLGGLPVLNVPVGFDTQGRPMGMQILGRFGADRQVLAFGLAYEQITDHLGVRPSLVDSRG